jgi:hypothetical protein
VRTKHPKIFFPPDQQALFCKIMTSLPSLFGACRPDNLREIPSPGLSLSSTGDGATLESWLQYDSVPREQNQRRRKKKKNLACLANLDKPAALCNFGLDSPWTRYPLTPKV